MQPFESMRLPVERMSTAPDGSEVRVLLGLAGGGMAHFELPPDQTSRAVAHRTVEEIWYFLAGQGEMWREQGGNSEVLEVSAGVCLTIPLGTRFQFRSVGETALSAIGVTMPPWPGDGEAVVVSGPWQPTQTRRNLRRARRR